MAAPKSILTSIFDTSFSTLITPRVVRLIFIVALAVGAFFTLSMVATTFAGSVGMGILALLFSPLIFFVGALYVRVMTELMMVQFQIHENIKRLADHVVDGGSNFQPPVDGRGVLHSPSSPSPGPSSASSSTPSLSTPSNEASSGWPSSNESSWSSPKGSDDSDDSSGSSGSGGSGWPSFQ